MQDPGFSTENLVSSSIANRKIRRSMQLRTIPRQDRVRETMDMRRQPIRALVVDDSAAALHSICGFLNLQPNIDVVGTASDGREGLASAHALHPDLVLLDVQMPVMNGIETAAQLRHDLPATRIVMVTVHDSPEVRQACRESGADGFIVKEHLDQELPALIQQIFVCGESRV